MHHDGHGFTGDYGETETATLLNQFCTYENQGSGLMEITGISSYFVKLHWYFLRHGYG